MCRATRCRTCGGTTWAGCGQHVQQVMEGVPKSQRCTCGKAGSKASSKQAGGEQKPSLLSRLRRG